MSMVFLVIFSQVVVIKTIIPPHLQGGYFFPQTEQYLVVKGSGVKVESVITLAPAPKPVEKKEKVITEKPAKVETVVVEKQIPVYKEIRVDTIRRVDTVSLWFPMIVFHKEASIEVEDAYLPALKDFAKIVRGKNVKIIVEGNSGPSSLVAFNKSLAQGRAENVKNILIRYGVDPKKIDMKISNEGPFTRIFVKEEPKGVVVPLPRP